MVRVYYRCKTCGAEDQTGQPYLLKSTGRTKTWHQLHSVAPHEVERVE